MSDSQSGAKMILAAIRSILIEDWDPIGSGVPSDEYDSYAPGIYRLLMDGATIEQLALHLGRLELEKLGLLGPLAKVAAARLPVARKLHALSSAKMPPH